MAKNIITVFGATGNQGNSIVQTFLNDPKLTKDWQVRGITRDIQKDSSKKLAASGVEVVAASLDDKATLLKAVEGSHTVFGVTNYWESMDHEKEFQQGKALVDAVKEAGVKHFIFSSLVNVEKLSKGVLTKVHHFDSKARVEEYARSQGVPSTFFLPGFFMSNIPGKAFRPVDNAWTFMFPTPGTAPIPAYATAQDTGKFIKAIVLHRDELLGKQFLGATEYTSPLKMIEDFKRVFPEAGKTARFLELTHEQYKQGLQASGMPEFAAEELLQNMRLLDEFGYYGGEPLEGSHKYVEDKLTTWADFIKTAKAFDGLK